MKLPSKVHESSSCWSNSAMSDPEAKTTSTQRSASDPAGQSVSEIPGAEAPRTPMIKVRINMKYVLGLGFKAY